MSTTTGRALIVAALLGLAARGAGAQQTPRFQSSVEVTSVDVTVVDGNGRPVTDLRPADFTVKVNGDERRVTSVEWVPLAAPPGPAPPPPPEGYSSNQGAGSGRLIVIAVDEPSIHTGDAAGILRTAAGFLDRLQPSDRVAAVSLGVGEAATPFTADRELVKKAISRMSGESRGSSVFAPNLSLYEATEIASPFGTNSLVFGAVAARECAGLAGPDREACQQQIADEAFLLQQESRFDTDRTLQSLGKLLEGLKAIDTPKTVVLVSGGLVLTDQESDVLRLGTLAAAARTSVYVLQSEAFLFDAARSQAPVMPAADRNLRSAGLDLLASASRGSLFRVIGDGSAAFGRIESEISGYYLLGVESDSGDKDGKAHGISVSVGRRGLTVRSRRQLPATTGEVAAAPSPREAVIASLVSPLPMSALSLRVATFSVREPATSKVQVIIHADIGAGYSSAQPVSLGYVISNKDGFVVSSVTAAARLPPVMNGVPSPLQFVTSASLEPGDYTLKLSVAEGDRIGSIEHPVHAGLVPAGPVALSELMAGGPVGADELMKPTVGYSVTFGTVQGYLEAYGPGSDSLSVKYEVATGAAAASLVEASTTGRSAGQERMIFSQMLPVSRLPPGKYLLRAIVSSAGQTLKTMTRPFEVEPPAVLMASATSLGAAAPARADLYLPVADTLFQRTFHRDEASRGDTLRLFRESVTPESRAAFDKGAASLSSGDYTSAEQSFRSALRVDDQSSVALAYLAATYAASGRDNEAAGAWQTSLIDGSDFPQIFEWLGDTLIRLRQLSEAKTILEEAMSKWPSDIRFAKPLALVYAAFGQGVEAVRLLERHLSIHQDDPEALALGVEWIYHVRTAGASAHSPAEDVKLAQGWADAYAKTKGPQAALVREWIQAIDGTKP